MQDEPALVCPVGAAEGLRDFVPVKRCRGIADEIQRGAVDEAFTLQAAGVFVQHGVQRDVAVCGHDRGKGEARVIGGCARPGGGAGLADGQRGIAVTLWQAGISSECGGLDACGVIAGGNRGEGDASG